MTIVSFVGRVETLKPPPNKSLESIKNRKWKHQFKLNIIL